MKRDSLHDRKVGVQGEDAATRFLEKKGYTVIERNCRSRWGELDIIAEKDGTLVFVEVKARADGGDPFDAVTPEKARRVRRQAETWLAKHPEHDEKDCRVDCVGVSFREGAPAVIEHIEDAIE